MKMKADRKKDLQEFTEKRCNNCIATKVCQNKANFSFKTFCPDYRSNGKFDSKKAVSEYKALKMKENQEVRLATLIQKATLTQKMEVKQFDDFKDFVKLCEFAEKRCNVCLNSASCKNKKEYQFKSICMNFNIDLKTFKKNGYSWFNLNGKKENGNY